MEAEGSRLDLVSIRSKDGSTHLVKNSWTLPAFYCLPMDILMNMQTPVRTLPRRPCELLLHPEYIEIIESDIFLEHMSDAIAYLAWPAMGMKGWMEYYSGDSPQWRIAHATDQWVLGMQQAGAIPANRKLFCRPLCFCEMPIPTLEKAFAMVATAAPYVLDRDSQGLVLETAMAFPCEEDFDLEKSHNRRLQNFRREWYHRRTKHPDVYYGVIVENTKFSHHDKLMSLAAEDDTEEEVVASQHGKAFYNTLSPLDQKIIYLRGKGKTLEQIAKKVGFATHSAVQKRIRKIGKAYELWSGEDLGFGQSPESKPSFDYSAIRRQQRIV